jgi:hypothetical protein
MGFRSPVRRSTLAEANESRDWRIYAELAQRLILQARKLYTNDDRGMDLQASAYALDSTTIDLCLSLSPFAPPSPPSKCTRRLICAGTYPRLSPSQLAMCTMSTSSTRYFLKQALTTSWTAAISTTPDSIVSTWPERSLSPVLSAISMPAGSTLGKWTSKDLVFLTNQFTLSAATICAIYKSRWKVELFFKWIKL